MKELFDKKFVHFMWSDELEGKEGFFADDICELTNVVLGGNMHLAKVRKSLSPAFPFKDTNNNDWLFFYYDPNYDCKVAYNEGKQIQFYCEVNEKWLDQLTPSWSYEYEYRIKPEEEQKKKLMTYRQLAEWLAKGNGQYTPLTPLLNKCFICSVTNYDCELDNETLKEGYKIRYWGSDEWITPTYDEYLNGTMIKG